MTVGDLARASWVTVLVALLGTPLGLLSAALTPRLAQYLLGPPDFSRLFFTPSAEYDPARLAGDGVMLAVLAGAGLLVGLLALAGRRTAALGTVLGLLVGGLVAGVVAMAVDHLVLAPGYAAVPRTDVNSTVISLRPYVGGHVDFVALPLVALLVFLAGNVPYLLRQRLSSGTAARG